jgi:ComEC/Rec2-related protein
VVGVLNAPADLRPTGCFYTLDVETVDFFDDEDGPRSAPGTLLLQARFPKKVTPHIGAQPGDRLSVSGRLQALPPARVPGAFDYGEFLRQHGVDVLLYASSERLDNTGPSGRHKLLRFGARLENRAARLFQKHLPSKEAALLSGLVLGSRPRFHPEMAQFFRDSGTMHILVASGSNVAFVQLLWYFLLRILFLCPRRWALVSSLPAVWTYVLVVGIDPPIVRAALMSTVGTLAYALVREDRPYHALALAALAILIPSPRTLFDVGFQMSFLTVFGLLYYLPPLEAWLVDKPLWLKIIARPMAVSVTAHLWLFPITAAIFRKMSPVAPVANLVVVPLSASGFVASFLVPLFPKLVCLYLKTILTVVEFFATHPGWTLWLFPPTVPWLIGYALFLVKPWRWIGALGLAVMLAAAVLDPHKQVKNTTLTFVDAGRQTWTLVRTPERTSLVVYPKEPTPEQRERLLMPFLMEKRVRQWKEILLDQKEPFVFQNILFFRGLSLRKQDELLEKNTRPEVVVGRFSARMLWRESFIRNVRPGVLVETGYDGARSPSTPPWTDATLIIPQKTGVYEWSDVTARAAEKPNADKTGQETAGVRPPRDAAHFAARSKSRHRTQPINRLDQKPQAEEKIRGDFDDADENEDGK